MYLPMNALLQGGKYRIVRFLNSGGFGCTYEAEHVMLEKRVAIKEFFVEDFCNRDELTAHVTVGTISKKEFVTNLKTKFIEEAKAVCQFVHPNIVRVTDVFEENGTAYFVMNFIEGRTLNEIVDEKGPLTEPEALRYIRQIADALQFVHARNRLHLDVKPSNIMIDKNDNAILIDFGASKQYSNEGGENNSTVLGKTPGYAPLEQMSNDVSRFLPATDIYSLGATLYKLLSGKTPLSANLLACGEILEPLPETISVSTRKLIMKSMDVNKKNRPQNIRDFLAKLDRITEFPKVKSFQKRKVSGKSVLYVFGGILALVLIVWGVSLISSLDFGADSKTLSKDAEKIAEDKVLTITDIDSISRTNARISYKNKNGVSFIYSGTTDSKGNPHGKGKGFYKDGTYFGKYENGIRVGYGIYVTRDKSNKFEGTYKNDTYKEGRLTYADGSYYKGTFSENNYETGKLYKKDNSVEMELVKGIPVKVRDYKMKDANGVDFVYTGNVNALCLPDGQGSGIYKDGTYVGTYKNGLRVGSGIYGTRDGSNHFKGTYANDGYKEGRLTYSDGTYFVGTFKRNDFHNGNYYSKDNKIVGKFVNGNYYEK